MNLAAGEANSLDAIFFFPPRDLLISQTGRDDALKKGNKVCFQSRVRDLRANLRRSTLMMSEKSERGPSSREEEKRPSTARRCCGCSITFTPCRAASAARAAHLPLTFALFIWPSFPRGRLEEGECSSTCGRQRQKRPRFERKKKKM